MKALNTDCLPMLIGSLPIDNHAKAMELILRYTPEIPLWPQLPAYKEEGMISQFLPGMPGLDECDGKPFVYGEGERFDTEFLQFYEDYITIGEGGGSLDDSRFALTADTAKGFFDFLHHVSPLRDTVTALKAQITGPVTFCTGLVDHNNRAIFYNEQLRDAAIKLLTLKARWQIEKMRGIYDTTIMIFDEPALAGYGSSAFITITQEDIKNCFAEAFEAVHAQGGIAGIHVCANTEWCVLFDAGVDLVSFDAYSFFDKLILYPKHLTAFFAKGGILASGIIPTSPEHIDGEDSDSLTMKWLEQAEQLEKIGIPMKTIARQTLITPSCGTGTISFDFALKVMELTRQVSSNLRKELAGMFD